MKLFDTFLKPPESVAASVATAAVVIGVYQFALPSIAEVHQTDPHNSNLDAARKKAMWMSLGVVGGLFIMTHDANVFSAGGIAFLAMEWSHRHANATHPGTGQLVPKSQTDMLNMGYQMPEDTSSQTPDNEYSYYGM